MTLVLRRRVQGVIIAALMILCLLPGTKLAAEDVAADISLSPAEQKWLDNHPEIILAPQARFYPFEFFDDNGSYRGVAADYVALLEQRLGVRFNIRQIDDPAQLQAAVNSGDVDIVAAAEQTSELVKGMRVTAPHIIFPGVIVAGEDYPDLASLAGKRVAVVDGQQWGALLSETHPLINAVLVSNTLAALEAISQGTVSALISDVATASYYIHREGMTDFRIVGKLDKNLELGIATRGDWPELNSIMAKALAKISDAEREKISRQWIHLKVPTLVLGKTFWLFLSSALATVMLGFSGFVLWTRSLRQQVAQRTRTIKLELQWRTAAELELQEAHKRLIQSHKKLQETQIQLIRAAKMESVGSLAAGIAHELKNPLTHIRLGIDYVRDEFTQEPIGQEVVKDMESAVQRADTVINSLLDFSRESKLFKRKCNLNTVIEDSLHLVRHELALNSIQIVRELQSPLPEVLLDENKIHQVFINLFQNAAQAMPQRGTLRIVTCLRDLPSGNLLVAEVHDNGPGISKESVEKIFDPFYTTKPVGKGTGLGLYVTKNILDLHDAEIKVSNRKDGGLSVIISFHMEQ